MRAEIAAIVRPTMKRLGWDGSADDERTRQLRGLVINVLGSNADDPETIARAREVYERGGADADVQTAAISVVAGNGGIDEFEQFVARAGATTSPQEQLRYLYSLGEFPSEDLVLRADRPRALRRDPRPERSVRRAARAAEPRTRRRGVGVRARQLGPGHVPVQSLVAPAIDRGHHVARRRRGRRRRDQVRRRRTRSPRAGARSPSTWNGCRYTARRLHANGIGSPRCCSPTARSGWRRTRRDCRLTIGIP